VLEDRLVLEISSNRLMEVDVVALFVFVVLYKLLIGLPSGFLDVGTDATDVGENSMHDLTCPREG
jgi:hypothetical protein